MKRQSRSFNQLERQLLAAVAKAGASGLADADADHIFKKRIPLAKRVQVFRKLQGLGLIQPSRSPGGGTLWKKPEPGAPQENGKEQPAGCVFGNSQWEPADPSLLRSFTCTLWPNLSIASCGKSIQF